MKTCKSHAKHDHFHSDACGHTTVRHEDHIDYLHDGHLHFRHEDHYDEHSLDITKENPADCTKGHECSDHEPKHQHGPNCGHERVPHGTHVDYLVNDHLHHPHQNHCDHHGKLIRVKKSL